MFGFCWDWNIVCMFAAPGYFLYNKILYLKLPMNCCKKWFFTNPHNTCHMWQTTQESFSRFCCIQSLCHYVKIFLANIFFPCFFVKVYIVITAELLQSSEPNSEARLINELRMCGTNCEITKYCGHVVDVDVDVVSKMCNFFRTVKFIFKIVFG